MPRNIRGQFVGANKISVKITKHLQEIADEVAIRVRPIVRDELERTLRSEVYASYTPATKKGQEIEEYNQTHKHQKPRLYHHTGKLASSISAIIDGNTIKIKFKNKTYDNGKTTEEVYDFLRFGTAPESSKKGFSYNNGEEFSTYIHQEPHNFEARTREHMRNFLKELETDLQQHPERYSRKYKNKRL